MILIIHVYEFSPPPPGPPTHTYTYMQPVNLYPPTSMGVYDVYGNVWEWTEDHFNGLPGFKTNYLDDDYSTPSFDSRHTMIMVRMFYHMAGKFGGELNLAVWRFILQPPN